jgi:hypothetical protein
LPEGKREPEREREREKEKDRGNNGLSYIEFLISIFSLTLRQFWSISENFYLSLTDKPLLLTSVFEIILSCYWVTIVNELYRIKIKCLK